MDVATLSDLVGCTGGTLYQYVPFNPVMDHDQVRVQAGMAVLETAQVQAQRAGSGSVCRVTVYHHPPWHYRALAAQRSARLGFFTWGHPKQLPFVTLSVNI